jgi:dephospho-CoA kinase
MRPSTGFPERPLLGLTGGIGSGKSQAAAFFAELNVDWVDADQVAREVVEPGEPVLLAIEQAFGANAIQANGQLNRAWLREEVFADDEQRRLLESLTHPAIRARILEKVKGFQSPYGLLVTPLLFETDQHTLVDAAIVVDVPETMQLARASVRDQADPLQIKRIMAAQMPREERLAKADFVLDNTQEVAALQAQVVQLHHSLLKQQASKR